MSDVIDHSPTRLTAHKRGSKGPRPCPVLGTLLVLAVTIMMIAGCAGHRQPASALNKQIGNTTLVWPVLDHDHNVAARAGCNLPEGDVLAGGSFTVAIVDSISPDHAPVPHNRGERFVFAQLYETLVRVDCQGNLRPGLASSWTCSSDSSTWVFSLRENARFWDGTFVTSTTVLEAWSRAQDQGGRRDPWTWLDAHAGTIRILDGRRLSISLPEPQAEFPLLLAHPAMAIAVWRQGWTWPVGSGPARLSADTPEPLPDLTCSPNLHHPRAPIWQSLTFHIQPGVDARDLVNQPWDLLTVTSLQDKAFFAGLPGFQVIPLPLNHTYLLLCPPNQNPGGSGAWWPQPSPGELKRAMTSVMWQPWDRLVIPGPSSGFCPQLLGPVAARTAVPLSWHLAAKKLDENTMVYPVNDAGAKQLAEFLAARIPNETHLQPLAPAPLEFVLQWQMVGAGIMAVDQTYPTGCLQLASLLGSIGWMQSFLPGHSSVPHESLAQAQDEENSLSRDSLEALVSSGAIFPLGASHGWLVMPNRTGGIALGYDGVPWLENWGKLAGLPDAKVDLP